MQARRLTGSLLSLLAAAALGPALLTSTSPAAAVTTRHAAGAVPAITAGTWGNAQHVPGLAALNKGNDATVDAISCGAAGNCSAGGFYLAKPHGHFQAFVVNETNGTWSTAQEVPGTAALNVGFEAKVTSMSCLSAGNCSAGGFYTDAAGHTQPFVVTETNGTWGAATEVLTKNPGGNAQITSISCAEPGDCTAVGFYRLTTFIVTRVFTVSEKNGVWGTAKNFPGLAPLRGAQTVTAVSCPSVSICVAGGALENRSGQGQPWVDTQTGGRWGTITLISGVPAAGIETLSCGAPGDCGAGGGYQPGDNKVHGFVVNETNGTWGTAEEVPGLAALSQDGASTDSVSCASAGNCTATGGYFSTGLQDHTFVVGETNGTWGTAQQVPGLAALGNGITVGSNVSCVTAGNCAITGFYEDSAKVDQGFVADETNGTWGTAQAIPGLAALNKFGAGGNVVACGAVGNCAVGGDYDNNGRQAFVVSES